MREATPESNPDCPDPGLHSARRNCGTGAQALLAKLQTIHLCSTGPLLPMPEEFTVSGLLCLVDDILYQGHIYLVDFLFSIGDEA